MREKLPAQGESIYQSLNNLDKAVSAAENSVNREAELKSLAEEYNQIFAIEIDNADNLMACGTLITEFANGYSSEEPNRLVYGCFNGFEVISFYGESYLAASIAPEDASFMPDEEDEIIGVKLLISNQPELGGHNLIFDVNVDALVPKILEWSAKIRDAQIKNKNIFKALKDDIRKLFSEYTKKIIERDGMSQLDAETAAITDILQYDVEALQYAIYTALNPANNNTLRILSRGSLVSANSDNRFDPSVQLRTIAEPITYRGTYQGVAIRTIYRKGTQGTITSISPQPCLAIFEYLNEQNVLIPFVSIQALQFGEQPEMHEQLPPSQRVSAEIIDQLDIIATDGDYEY